MHRFRILIVGTLAVVTFLWTGGFVAPEPTASSQELVLAIRNGRLFDGTGAPPIGDAIVIIEGNRIAEVGPAGQVQIPPSARTIDAAGGLIMPGIIDNHTHVKDWVAEREDVFTPWVRSGVTTLVDNGTRPEFTASLRDLMGEVAQEAPRLFVAGPVLTIPGGYPVPVFGPEFVQFVTTPEEARAVVANMIDDQGVNLIKVAIEAGFGEDFDLSGPTEWPVLPPETLAAIAEAAHERGISVRAHVTHPRELQAALDADFDVANHTPIVPLSDELLQQAVDADMILVSTANIWGFISDSTSLTIAENLSRYAQLGGRVAMGTDAPIGHPPGQMPVLELQLLIDGGLTPTEVLVAATKHGAEAFGQGDELGTLEPGKLADIIVVAGDPLSDIGDMENVSIVVRDGEVVQPPSTTMPATGHGPVDAGQRQTFATIAGLLVMGALLVGVGLLAALRP